MPILTLGGEVRFEATFFASPDYGGPTLIRGQRLDGPGTTLFLDTAGSKPESVCPFAVLSAAVLSAIVDHGPEDVP